MINQLLCQASPLSTSGQSALRASEKIEGGFVMVRLAVPLALILLTGCARSEKASFVPADNNALSEVERVRTPDSDEEELTLGTWRDGLQDEQAALEFGPAGAAPLFSLRCDARRSLLLQRHGAATAGDLPVMLVTVGSETRRLAVTGAGGPIPMLRAALPPNDPYLAILTGAISPIIIRIGDSPPLVLPTSPRIGAYVTQCSSGAVARPRAGEETTNGVAESNVSASANTAAPTGR
jgi:hypothetical protein